MFLLARPRTDVIAALEAAHAFGMVGPEAGGWCAAELPYDQTISVASAGATWIDLAVDGPRDWIIAIGADTAPTVFRVRGGAVPDGLAAALAAAAGRADLAGEVGEQLTRFLAGQREETGPPELAEALAAVLPFPAPGSRPGTGTTVVLSNHPVADLREFAPVLGPVDLVPTGTDWTAFVAAEDGTHAFGLVAGLSSLKRRTVGVLLDRDADHEGFHVWRHGKPVAGWNWSRDWADVAPVEAELESEREVTAVLTRLWPDLDTLAFKTLLRSDPAAGGQLERLVELLGLPATALEIAAAPSSFAGHEAIAKQSVREIVSAGMRSEWAGRWEGKQRLRRWDVGFSVACALVLGTLALIGLLQGDLFPPFAAGFLVALPIAVVRVRGLLRAEREARASASD